VSLSLALSVGAPVPEAFYDIWIYPAQVEYTVDGFGQNAYVWGYFAAGEAAR